MKNIFCLTAIFAVLFAFTACKDDNDNSSNTEQEQTAEADYTVIFWSMLGTNDELVFADLGDMINLRKSGQIGKNVNFVGLMKTSPSTHFLEAGLQDSLKQYGLDGTQYIELPENPDVNLGNMEYKGENYPIKTPSQIAKVYKAFNPKKYGGTDYPLDNPDSLSAFIKKVAKSHPAKHYVLMLLGHGSGYIPYQEVENPDGYTTRGCVIDDYSGNCLTADNIVAAVNKSGVHIQTLFCQNCLMSTLENLAAFQHCADYAIISAEVTTSQYLQHYLANISQAGDDLEKMKDAARKTIDYYADVVNAENDDYTSHGFWDLSKVNDILNTVAKISTWYSEAFDKDPDYINQCVSSATTICDYTANLSSVSGGDIIYDKILMESRDFIYKTVNDEAALANPDSLKKLSNCLKNVALVTIPTGFGFAYMMYSTLNIYKESGTNPALDFTTFQTYYDTYLQQVKDAAYIRANHEVTSRKDYAYILVSPTINIFAMNDEHYKRPGVYDYLDEGTLDDKINEFANVTIAGDEAQSNALYLDLFDGNQFASMAPLSTVMTNYTASQFDRQCHWSTLLKKLTVNPNYITNLSRKNINSMKLNK